MADTLYFNRDTRVFIKLTGQSDAWEIPVLDGFSFSQATNNTEVTLSEMEGASGTRRARQMFNDSFAPAEWSFSTYAQPYHNGSRDTSVEEVLWALISGPAVKESAGFTTAASSGTSYITQGTNKQIISFGQSNRGTLGTADIYFVMGTNAATENTDDILAYKISGCVINELNFEMDVEGIATLNWSGFGTLITEATITASEGAPTSSVTAGDLWLDTDQTSNTDHAGDDVCPIKIAGSSTDASAFVADVITPTTTKIGDVNTYVRNRLSYLEIKDVNDSNNVYTIVLTGGNLTINNNISFITPETLGQINTPMGHVTGARNISGTVNCYLNGEDDHSADLLKKLVEDTTSITQKYNIEWNVGGTTGNTDGVPCLSFAMPQSHLEIPTHSLEDIISVETNFHALPSNIDSADELTVEYTG